MSSVGLCSRSLFTQIGPEEWGAGPCCGPPVQLRLSNHSCWHSWASIPLIDYFLLPISAISGFLTQTTTRSHIYGILQCSAAMGDKTTAREQTMPKIIKAEQTFIDLFILFLLWFAKRPVKELWAIERLKNIVGLEALWQNFFQWAAEEEGQSQPPVSF